MTNEELAKSILMELEYGYISYGNLHGNNEQGLNLIKGAIEKQNKYRWHDLRKDPNDLPSVGKYLVKIMCELGEWYELNDFTETKNWIYIDFYHQEDATDCVVAWREIEPFEEVSE